MRTAEYALRVDAQAYRPNRRKLEPQMLLLLKSTQRMHSTECAHLLPECMERMQ